MSGILNQSNGRHTRQFTCEFDFRLTETQCMCPQGLKHIKLPIALWSIQTEHIMTGVVLASRSRLFSSKSSLLGSSCLRIKHSCNCILKWDFSSTSRCICLLTSDWCISRIWRLWIWLGCFSGIFSYLPDYLIKLKSLNGIQSAIKIQGENY